MIRNCTWLPARFSVNCVFDKEFAARNIFLVAFAKNTPLAFRSGEETLCTAMKALLFF